MKDNLHQVINENPLTIAGRKIVDQIVAAGKEAFFVGGGVRDMLLGHFPKDIDIATSAHPDELRSLFPGATLVGARFGVMMVPCDGHMIEVATFREEGPYHDRRRPESIKFSSIENDSRRRDFTCNALYLDPLTGQIVDFFGGQEDIKVRLLRAVGIPADRFNEDALRLMRALRFASNLDFAFDPATWKAVCEHADLICEISAERVRDELIKGFSGPAPVRYLDLLDKSGILALVLPEMIELKRCMQPPQFHPEGDVYKHTRLMLSHLREDASTDLIFAVLLHDIGKPPTQTFEDRIRFNGHDKVGAAMAENILKRLRFSNDVISRITAMVARHMQFINLPQMRKATLKRFLSVETIDDELELHRCDCLGSHGDLSTYEFARTQMEEFRNDQARILPLPFISGRDLIELGLKPGPIFAVLLKEIYDQQLEGNLTDRAEALAYLCKNHNTEPFGIRSNENN